MCLTINFMVFKFSFEGQRGWDGAACFYFDAFNKRRLACFYFSCVPLKGGGVYHQLLRSFQYPAQCMYSGVQ